MKHGIKGRKLNRTSAHRKSLFSNLSNALLKNELIKTTLPKAKDLRPIVEKIITLAKVDNLANRRRALAILKNEELVNKLFSDIAVRVKSRNGGYTRIMKYGFRTGDKAPMAIIELVDREAVVAEAKEVKTKKVSKAKKA
jgi:large subunit ribosomal protein L17